MVASHIGSHCCFPVMSFLHVPGKMSQPMWLMMGTAFLVQHRHPTSTSNGKPGRLLLLTAKHTFAPWQYISDPQRLKIPDEYRKLRFILGRLYLPDDEGRAMVSRAVDLQLLALHPTLDVGLLTVRTPPAAAAASEKGEADAFAELKRRVAAVGGGLAISAVDPTKGDLCVIPGYRGAGSLGLLDTFDPDLLHRLPTEQREELLSSLKNVEGQQILVTPQVEVLHASGMCCATEGCCYHGMSGAPVLIDGETCGGVLYGKHAVHSEHLGYTPACSFRDWMERAAGAE